MRLRSLGLKIGGGLGVASLAAAAWGQASPTATATFQLAAFGGATGVYTGIGNARNLSITAGVDATIRPFFGFFPSLEVRGTYPVDSGAVVGEKNVLAGLAFERHLGRVHPYGDVLVGRGAMQFVVPYANPSDTVVYEETVSTVLSPGAGVDFFVSDRFALKADFQLQHYNTPVTASGSVFAEALTLGLVYRLPFDGLGHGRR